MSEKTYEMEGQCCNCKTSHIPMVFIFGKRAEFLDCPVCGNEKTVRPVSIKDKPIDETRSAR